MMRKKRYIFLVLAMIVFFTTVIIEGVKEAHFDRNCTQYIERAAHANSVETAKENLAKAISYVETNNLTEGTVAVLFPQPKDDIGYWYDNIVDAYTVLENLPEDASNLEKTSVLTRIKDALTDEDESGAYVVTPEGIGVYPNNALYFWVEMASGFFVMIMSATQFLTKRRWY